MYLQRVPIVCGILLFFLQANLVVTNEQLYVSMVENDFLPKLVRKLNATHTSAVLARIGEFILKAITMLFALNEDTKKVVSISCDPRR